MARAHDPAEKLSALRGIVAHHQHGKVQGVRVDATTANAILTVHDLFSAENQAQFLALPIGRMADVAWKLIAGSRVRGDDVCTTINQRGGESGHTCKNCNGTRQREPYWAAES